MKRESYSRGKYTLKMLILFLLRIEMIICYNYKSIYIAAKAACSLVIYRIKSTYNKDNSDLLT